MTPLEATIETVRDALLKAEQAGGMWTVTIHPEFQIMPPKDGYASRKRGPKTKILIEIDETRSPSKLAL